VAAFSIVELREALLSEVGSVRDVLLCAGALVDDFSSLVDAAVNSDQLVFE